MTDNFKEIGSLFGREGAGAGFAKQTDKESFTYAFAWPEGDTWATLTGYLNLDEQPEEYVRRVLQDGGFRSDWGNPDYDPIGDFKETAGDEYRIPLLKVLLREQLESRYEVANHFSTMNRARVELSAFIQNEGDTPLIAGIKPDGTGNYGEREVETNMVLSVYSRQNFIRYFALLRDMDAFVFVSGRKIDALEDLSGLPLAGNCSGLDIDRILQRPKCLG